MKIRTDFAGAVPWLVPGLIWGGTAAAAVGLLFAILLVINGWRDHAALPSLEKRLVVLETRQAKEPPSAHAIPMRDLERVSERVRVINGIPGASGPAVRAVLTVFERSLPPGSHLVSLRYEASAGRWDLVTESRTDDELTTFLDRLEQARFTSVLLRKQRDVHDAQGSRTRGQIVVQE